LNLNPEIIDWYENYIINLYDVIKTKVIRYNINNEIEPWICTWNEKADRQWERIYNKIIDMINSDSENEFVKSMLSKQISYIPRFALLLNTLYNYDLDDPNFLITEITEKSVLSAEKLSDYFILMAKKIKFDTIEKRELKDLVNDIKDMPLKEKIIHIFQVIPDANKTEVAELLNTSRQTIYKNLK
jgi:DNA-directed RNA polymerase specialized sigma subunit